MSKLRTGRPAKPKASEAGEPQDSSEDSSDDDETVDKVRVAFDKAMLPNGYTWVIHDHDNLKKSYKTVSGPEGETFTSRTKAWDHSQRQARNTQSVRGRLPPRHMSPTMTSRRASMSPQQEPKKIVTATTSRQLGKQPEVYVPSESTRNSRALRSLAGSSKPCSTPADLTVAHSGSDTSE